MLSPAGGVTIPWGPGVGPREEVFGEAAFPEAVPGAAFPEGAAILAAADRAENGESYVLEKAS